MYDKERERNLDCGMFTEVIEYRGSPLYFEQNFIALALVYYDFSHVY